MIVFIKKFFLSVEIDIVYLFCRLSKPTQIMIFMKMLFSLALSKYPIYLCGWNRRLKQCSWLFQLILLVHLTNDKHCVKNVRIRKFSGSHFPAFGLNTEQRYGVSLPIQSKCGKIRTRKTSNTYTFQAVKTTFKNHRFALR